MRHATVQQATHVKFNGKIEKIASIWGVDEEGRLAKPSDGGFGVVTADGQRVSMWEAEAYFREEPNVEAEVSALELYAWVGRDEFGSGVVGLKQGKVPAGTIPMVAIEREKLEQFWVQAERQAQRYGERIFLVRFQAVEVVNKTEAGA